MCFRNFSVNNGQSSSSHSIWQTRVCFLKKQETKKQINKKMQTAEWMIATKKKHSWLGTGQFVIPKKTKKNILDKEIANLYH